MDDGRPATSPAPAPVRVDGAAAAVGGAIGASARWSIGTLLDVESASSGAFPWHTFVVNVVGCLAIGLLAARLDGTARTFAVTGVLGGFTTMSAFAVEVDALGGASTATALVYLGASVGVGLLAVTVGDLAARRSAASSGSDPAPDRSGR